MEVDLGTLRAPAYLQYQTTDAGTRKHAGTSVMKVARERSGNSWFRYIKLSLQKLGVTRHGLTY